MKITFDPKGKRGKRYPCEREDGTTIYLPSVTEILDVISKGEALVQWAANQERTLVTEAACQLYEDLRGLPKPIDGATYAASLANRLTKTKAWRRELDAAAEIGTGAHKMVEWACRKMLGQEVPEPAVKEKSLWAYMAWDDWRKSVDFKPLMMEQQVWSEDHLYAGTFDILGLVGGKRTLIDLKTSKAIYPTMEIQVAAYARALAEMGHEAPESLLILRLPKKESDPDFEAHPVNESVDALFSIFLHALAIYNWKVETQRDGA